MPTYHLCASVNKGFLSVTGTFEVSSGTVCLQLPVWRPGRYMAQNYAKRIRNLRFTDADGNNLPAEKTNAHTWLLHCPTGLLTATYEYAGDKPDAGNCFVSDELLYVNPVNCLLYTHLSNPCTLTATAAGRYAGMLPAAETSTNQGLTNITLSTDDFYTLADAPFAISTLLHEQEYQVANTTFKIAAVGHRHPHDLNSIFRTFTQAQHLLFGEFPFSEYTFLLLILPYKHYHGVEHASGTVIVLGPDTELSTPEFVQELAGIACHELFHAWNALAIRPEALRPYNYAEVPTFDTGYVIEGFTTYYGDYLLSRSGALPVHFYLAELERSINRHFGNAGRYSLSLADSSVDLSVDGYEAGVPGRKVSIYNEGALAALILDAKLRQLSHNADSLDRVMKDLWQKFGKPATGYRHQDLLQLAGEAAPLLHELTTVPGSLERHLGEALHYWGLELRPTEHPDTLWAYYGAQTVTRQEQLLVLSTVPGSAAARVLAPGDLIITHTFAEDGALKLHVASTLNNFDTRIARAATPYLWHYTVAAAQHPTAAQKENFEHWMHTPFSEIKIQ